MRLIGAAQELLDYGADRTDRALWLETRRLGITASEIATILGLSKWNSPLSLYFAKLGVLDENEGDYRMALGTALEPYVISCFTRLTSKTTETVGLLQSTERDWQLATPDALADGHHPLEAKTALSEDDWGPSGSEMIPLYYRCQLLWQMDVLGADYGFLCVVFLRSGEPRWYRIDWDGGDVAVMREAALEFLDRLERSRPPRPDSHEATQRALRGAYPPRADVTATCSRRLRIQYAASLKRRREADEKHMLVTNKIRYEMGFASRLVDPDGDTVATRRGAKDALYPGRNLTKGKD
jgi:putative phage-type endonuclease